MNKGALKGIGDVIKAHSTEKSIDELKAQGKNRVRVVSGRRVMEIIQAIVDDTIDREVGVITKRDRDHIVSDARARFDRVLKMQTDLEQTVSGLRSELRDGELERERLRSDKSLLEQQIATARMAGVEPGATTRLGRDLERLRTAVDEIGRRVVTAEEGAVARAVERLASRDEAQARRIGAELDDVRKRIDGVSWDTSRNQESMLEAFATRMSEAQRHTEKDLGSRLEAEFGAMQERITDLRDRVTKSASSDEVIHRMRGDLAALEDRVRSVASSSGEVADRVSAVVTAEVASLRQAIARSDGREDAASADALASVQKHLADQLAEESAALRRAVVEVGAMVSAIDERTGNAVEAVAERVAERVVLDEGALTDAVARVASRVDARIDEISHAVTEAEEHRVGDTELLRVDLLGAAADRAGLHAVLETLADRLDAFFAGMRDEWTVRQGALLQAVHEGNSRLDERVTSATEQASAVDAGLNDRLESAVACALTPALATAFGKLGEDVAAVGSATSAASDRALATTERVLGDVRHEVSVIREDLAGITSRAASSEPGLHAAVHESLSGLRDELTALAERQVAAQSATAETAARQDDAMVALREQITAAAAAQSAASNDRFESALDRALDKITRTMESATARPIDISIEATDVLLDKIFDAGDQELSSNLDQLDVEQRKSNGITRSLGKLRAALHAPSRNGTDD